jgi:hypothetical protein
MKCRAHGRARWSALGTVLGVVAAVALPLIAATPAGATGSSCIGPSGPVILSVNNSTAVSQVYSLAFSSGDWDAGDQVTFTGPAVTNASVSVNSVVVASKSVGPLVYSFPTNLPPSSSSTVQVQATAAAGTWLMVLCGPGTTALPLNLHSPVRATGSSCIKPSAGGPVIFSVNNSTAVSQVYSLAFSSGDWDAGDQVTFIGPAVTNASVSVNSVVVASSSVGTLKYAFPTSLPPSSSSTVQVQATAASGTWLMVVCGPETTAPTAHPTQSPAAGANGWNNTDVTVHWNWTDAGYSGIDTNNCPSSTTSSGVGQITLNASCTDNAGNTGTASHKVMVDGFTITTASLPTALLGHPYLAQLTPSGGTPPVKWKKIGKLPKGLKLNAKTGTITGVPKTTGTVPFGVQASYKAKANGQPVVKHTTSKLLSITVT